MSPDQEVLDDVSTMTAGFYLFLVSSRGRNSSSRTLIVGKDFIINYEILQGHLQIHLHGSAVLSFSFLETAAAT